MAAPPELEMEPGAFRWFCNQSPITVANAKQTTAMIANFIAVFFVILTAKVESLMPVACGNGHSTVRFIILYLRRAHRS